MKKLEHKICCGNRPSKKAMGVISCLPKFIIYGVMIDDLITKDTFEPIECLHQERSTVFCRYTNTEERLLHFAKKHAFWDKEAGFTRKTVEHKEKLLMCLGRSIKADDLKKDGIIVKHQQQRQF